MSLCRELCNHSHPLGAKFGPINIRKVREGMRAHGKSRGRSGVGGGREWVEGGGATLGSTGAPWMV